MEDYVSNDSSYTSNESMMSGIKKEYKRGPYKNYTVEQKQAAVKMLLEGKCSVIEISRKLQIPCKNIKRWSQQGV
jgi:transposase-like protein